MKNKLFYLLFSTTLFYACGENKNEETNKTTPSEKEEEKELIKEPNTNSYHWENGVYFFKGLINFKYAFHMRFTVEDNSINGAYYYDTQKKEIELKGSIINRNLEVDESFKDKVTGHFSSDVFTSDSISGIWKSPKDIQFPFALFHSKENEYLSSMEENKKNHWTNEEFKTFVSKFETGKIPFKYEPKSEDTPDVKMFTEKEIKLFAYPEFDPENDFGYHFIFGKKYETENFIALIYTEVYYPGAFGIYNHFLVMKTFSLDGKFIDEKYLGCECYDSNYDDYYSTSEEFQFNKNTIVITGTETHASQDWAEEESGTEPFNESKPINRSIKITEEGKFL